MNMDQYNNPFRDPRQLGPRSQWHPPPGYQSFSGTIPDQQPPYNQDPVNHDVYARRKPQVPLYSTADRNRRQFSTDPRYSQNQPTHHYYQPDQAYQTEPFQNSYSRRTTPHRYLLCPTTAFPQPTRTRDGQDYSLNQFPGNPRYQPSHHIPQDNPPGQVHHAEPFQGNYSTGKPGRYPHYSTPNSLPAPDRPRERSGYNMSRFQEVPRDNSSQLGSPNYHYPADYYTLQLHQPEGDQDYQWQPTNQDLPNIQIQSFVTLNRDNQDLTGILIIPQTRNVAPHSSNRLVNLQTEPWNTGNPARFPNPRPWTVATTQR